MQASAKRRDRSLPRLSGQTLSGAIVLIVAAGFATAAFPSLVSRSIARPDPFASQPPRAPSPLAPSVSAAGPQARLPGEEDAPGAGPAGAPEDATSRVQRPGNRPPIVEAVRFASEVVTTRGDLRLQIQAWDPDGDPLTVHTHWQVDGRPLEATRPVLARSDFVRGSRLRATVVADDGSHQSEPFTTAEIVVANAPPTITTFPKGFDATGAFVYPLGAVDPDGDHRLEFLLLEGPRGMRIEAHEGTLTWRPRPDQAGSHRVHLEVRDGYGGSESQVFVLEVRPGRVADGSLAER
jgi:hypothetical protein